MNTAIGNGAINVWKRIKLQHISAVFGLAMAASAAVAVGTWERDQAPTPVPSRITSGNFESIQDYTLREQAALEILGPSVQPMFTSAADAEYAARGLQASILASVISTERAVYGDTAQTVPQRQPAEADIAASVLSTELANFGSSKVVQPMFPTAADAEFAARALVQDAALR